MTVDHRLRNWLHVGARPEKIPLDEPYRYAVGVYPDDDDCGSYYARQLPRVGVSSWQDHCREETVFLFSYGDVLATRVVVTDLEQAAFASGGHRSGLFRMIVGRIDPPYLVDWFGPLLDEAWIRSVN